jgi:hypothetical protein
MSYSKPYYSFTFFGSHYDIEPPDPLFVHKECYEKKTEEQKRSFESICWIKPHLINYDTSN